MLDRKKVQWRGIFGLGLFATCTGCSLEAHSGPDELSGKSSDGLLGNVIETRIEPWVRATARVTMMAGGSCSGTLVAPDRVITAAHCLCKSSAAFVRFANDLGQIADVDPVWPVINSVWHPNAQVCGDPFMDLSDDDPVAYSPWDVAVLTLGTSPNTGGLPTTPFLRPSTSTTDAIPVIKPILAEGSEAIAARRLSEPVRSAGYGDNAPINWSPDTCIGCGTRRSGPVFKVKLKDDPCEYLLGVPLEGDCWTGNMWVAPSIVGQLPNSGVQISAGDSGGGLFFSDAITNGFVLGAVASNVLIATFPDGAEDENYQRWASLGLSSDFLYDALGMPTLTMTEQRQGTAVFARNRLLINDRAFVRTVPGGPPARLVSMAREGIDPTSPRQGRVRIGVEAHVEGPILAKGPTTLSDRSVVQDVTSAARIVRQNNVTAGAVLPAEWVKFEDFTLSDPFPTGPNDSRVITSNTTLVPGAYGNVAVHSGATLTLQPNSVYTFRDLDMMTGTTLSANGPVWIYVRTSGDLQLRGMIRGIQGQLFIGAPRAQWIVIGADTIATIVAPSAAVSIDMLAFHQFFGSVFCNDFELHQGRYFHYARFQKNWIPSCSGSGGFTGCL